MKSVPSSVRLVTSLYAGIAVLVKLVEDNSISSRSGYNSR